jgi:hypothetical protein
MSKVQKYCCRWQEGQDALIRAYSKSLQTRNKNKVRGRRQERPNKPFKDALKVRGRGIEYVQK